MKKTLYHFCSVLLILLSFSSIYAQSPTLKSTDFPQVGDRIVNFTADTTGLKFPKGGAGVTWDYSTISPNATKDSSVSLAVTPKSTGYDTAFPKANYATASLKGNTYLYGIMSSSQFETIGYYSYDSATKISQVRKYSNTLINYTFPITYSSTNSDSYYVAYNNGVQASVEHGSHKYTAIGYGTLKMPKTTFKNVLLLRDSNTSYTTVNKTTTKITAITNAFITPGKKGNILTFFSTTYSIFGLKVKSLLVYYNQSYTTGLEDGVSKIEDYALYPNPTNYNSNLEVICKIASKATISISDLSGKIINQQMVYLNEGKNKTELDVQNLKAGIYLVSVKGQGVNIIEKLIKH